MTKLDRMINIIKNQIRFSKDIYDLNIVLKTIVKTKRTYKDSQLDYLYELVTGMIKEEKRQINDNLRN